MKAFKQVMGALSRDMLFLHGHIISIQGLDGAAQRSAYPTTPKKTESSRETRGTCKECTA
ncbi:MAG TPA: hypothetical protein VFL78_03465 [Rhodanobacteraceae bacterium]|jgi:hypothetical protein|nr:hypothetical protein [Rhodanobacteraceae bacterium]